MGWTKTDVYAFVNDLVDQATKGNAQIKVTDTSSLVEAGHILEDIGYEKTLDCISQVYAKNIYSIRKYTGKLDILRRDEKEWGSIIRKFTPLKKDLEASQDNNTDIATPLEDGESVDEFKINKPDVLQTVFNHESVITKSITHFTQDQLNVAFESEASFMAFLDLVDESFDNELEMDFEEMRRATIANLIGGCYTIGGAMAIDLVAEFNAKFAEPGSGYSRDQLMTTHFENFSKFIAARIKGVSRLFTENTSKFHQNVSGRKPILRHTPKQYQRMVIYAPYMDDQETMVLSSLYNPEKLDIGEYEEVNFWQDIEHPSAINITPSYMDSDGKETKGEAVKLDYVLGILFDVEAAMWTNIFRSVNTSHLNTAGLYYNTWYHSTQNFAIDSTENAVVFYLGEGETPAPAGSIELNKNATTLAAGATETLTALTVPADAEITWESDDDTIASVEDGVITAVAEGEAIITATIEVEGIEYSDACVVTVTAESKAKKTTKK